LQAGNQAERQEAGMQIFEGDYYHILKLQSPDPACLVSANTQKYISLAEQQEGSLAYASGQEGTCR